MLKKRSIVLSREINHGRQRESIKIQIKINQKGKIQKKNEIQK